GSKDGQLKSVAVPDFVLRFCSILQGHTRTVTLTHFTAKRYNKPFNIAEFDVCLGRSDENSR
ncbi:MAG: hypothetical protein KAI69_03685, partial [Deltaproteobacteria bacterium]|nr:hypothetical protein [Deltaproteobacteria bacterium]